MRQARENLDGFVHATDPPMPCVRVDQQAEQVAIDRQQTRDLRDQNAPAIQTLALTGGLCADLLCFELAGFTAGSIGQFQGLTHDRRGDRLEAQFRQGLSDLLL